MTLWTLDDIAPPLWWFHGADGPFTSTQWTDKTGDYHATSTGPYFNAWIFASPNRYPATVGTRRFIVTESVATPPSSYTIISVFFYSAAISTEYIHRGVSSDVTKEWGSARKVALKISLLRANGGSSGYLTTTNDVLVSGYDKVGLIVQTYSSGDLREALRVNGQAVPLTDVTVSTPAFSVSGPTEHSFGSGFDGILGTLVYDRVLSAEDIEKVEGYLYHHFMDDSEVAAYYSFPFLSTHPYYSAPPATFDGVIDQPLSEVSGAAINGSFIGVVDQPASEVSGLAKVYSLGYGAVVHPLSEVLSFAVSPLVAFGDIQQELSIVSGAAGSLLDPIFADGVVEQGNDVSGLAANGVVLGQVEQPSSTVAGFAVVPNVGFGVIRDYLSVVDGFSYVGVHIGTGVVDQPTSTVFGAAQTWIIARGSISASFSEVSGYAVNYDSLLAFGQIEQARSTVQGIGATLSAAYGEVAQLDDISGLAICPNVCFGVILQEVDALYGRAIYAPESVDLEFYRCSSGPLPTIDVANPDPFSYSRNNCGAFDELETAPDPIPLSFSR